VIAILGIFAMAVFGGGVYLFRSMGRMQPPSTQDRLRHNPSHSDLTRRQRATGLD